MVVTQEKPGGSSRRYGSATDRRNARKPEFRSGICAFTSRSASLRTNHLADSPEIDQVVGARTSEEGSLKIFRVPAKWFVRKLAERLTNGHIPDLNSGLRAFRRSLALPYLRLLPPGISSVTTITLAFLSIVHEVRYAP